MSSGLTRGFLAAFLCLGFFILIAAPARAISANVHQVKTNDSPVVYFLSQKYHLKKAYVNETSYLNYGNQWSDIKIVSDSELSSWPDAKLFKTAASPAVYYISGNRKSLLLNMNDLADFGLVGQPILEVSAIDLEQYQTVSYEDIGLQKTSNLLVFSDPVANASNNSIVSGTDNNLIGIFRFRSPLTAETISSLTFNLVGIYSSAVVAKASVTDENNNSYKANVIWNASKRQILVNFRDPLDLSSGADKTVEVFLDLKTCATCTHQTLHLEMANAASVTGSLPASAAWPVVGTSFNLLPGTNVLGQVRVQEESLASSNLTINNGSRLIGKFTIYEDSGNEEALITQIVFDNNGSANDRDLEDFRLLKDNQVIARTAAFDTNGRITFDIDYLRVSQGSPATLTVLGGLKTGYTSQDTFDLEISSLTAQGRTYNLSLSPTINNLEEVYPLN